MKHHVKVGAVVPVGVKGVQYITNLKLGDFILTKIPLDFQEAVNVSNYCREHKIYFMFSEWLYRGSFELLMTEHKRIERKDFYTREQLEEITAVAGEYYMGRITLGEAGGMLYWPKEYIIERASKNYLNLPPCNTVGEARDEYVKVMQSTIDYERKELGGGKLWDVDSSMTFKYHGEAGLDGFIIESMPGDNNFLYSSIRGAAKGLGKPWGAHIAMSCYGGSNIIDKMWLKRWQVSLYYSYIAGAEFIYPESGHFTHYEYKFDSPEMKESRLILRNFNQFANIHSRPTKNPEIKIAFAYGHLDGHPGLWNKYSWGQYKSGDKWLSGPAERGWKFTDKIYRKEDWSNAYVHGEHDFSGHPAGGLYDVIPIESPIEILKQYQCIIFLAWNTMTEEIYEKIKEYVVSGGHVLMSVPHLNMETDRGKDFKLYNNGDVKDLFGVKIKGKGKTAVNGVGIANESTLDSYVFTKMAWDPRFIGNFTPAEVEVSDALVIAGIRNFHDFDDKKVCSSPLLLEKSLGKGKAFLVTTWSWPGDEGMEEFYEDILRTVFAGEKTKIMVNGSDRIQHAVYDNVGFKTLYLLNTDLDNDLNASIFLDDKKVAELLLKSADIRPTFIFNDIVLVPESKFTNLKLYIDDNGRYNIALTSLNSQVIEIYNTTQVGVPISLNGENIYCMGQQSMTIGRSVDPDKKVFFADDFLEEPDLIWNDGGLPY